MVALARRVGGSGAPPEVHAFRTTGETWVAACGAKASPEDLELVPSFTGAPCMTCFMTAALASGVAPVTREQLEAPLRELEEPPGELVIEGAPTPDEPFAVSLREKLVHRVAPDAPRTELNGRPVVISECGLLGWPCENAPEGWEMCAGCDEATGARA